MAEFYESAAGQSLLDKTPALMQNVVVAIQARTASTDAESLNRDSAIASDIRSRKPGPSN